MAPLERVSRSVDTVNRLRNEESWVEISSQPSSSSLSSVGDEIITTGLHVQSESHPRRHRRANPAGPTRINLQQRSTSSQDEYEESESEEDRIMTSSNERVMTFTRVPPLIQEKRHPHSDSDDENATALGKVIDEPIFTPQPNAFSHPPSAQVSQPHSVAGSYFPRHPVPQSQERRSYKSRGPSRTQHTPYNAISAAHQVDHDAALRASLTTLLSCAAAARGLSKRSSTAPVTNGPAWNEVSGLRMVPGSELKGTSPINSRPLSPTTRPHCSPSISEQEIAVEKGKRKAAANKPNVQPRAAKKKKIAVVEEAMISPTLLTWVVSAGVVVLVSVVGFSAGYAIGKEVGRQETLSGLSDNSSCGKEAMRQVSEIRRFRWGNGKGIVV